MSASDPARAFLRALRVDVRAAGLTLDDATITARNWASATFVGHRHAIALTVSGGDPAAWLARLPEAEWRLPGHIVVDLAVDSVDGAHVALSALTVAAA